MGMYVLNAGEHPSKGNAETLLEKHGAVELKQAPRSFSSVPPEAYLICVVDNGSWEGAGIAYSERQFMRFTRDPTGRPKRWLYVPKEEVERLSPHVAEAAMEEE